MNIQPPIGSIVTVSLWLQRFVACLLLLAVGNVSAMGRVMGYRCQCDPAAQTVSVPHCDGPTCHPGRAHADGCEADGDQAPCGDEHSHDHEVVRAPYHWAVERADADAPLPLPVAVPAPAWQQSVLPDFASTVQPAPALSPSPPRVRLIFLTTLLRI